MMTVKIRVSRWVDVEAEDIAGILTTAFGPEGVGYWCRGYQVVEDPTTTPEDYVPCEAPAYGGALKLFFADETKPGCVGEMVIRLRDVCCGLEMAAGSIPSLGEEGWVADVDAGLADTIVQYAAFGEERYC